MISAIEQRLLCELLEACPDAIEVFDLDGKILYVNKAGTLYHAKSANEMVGTSIWDLYPSSQAAHRKTMLNKATSSRLPVRFTDRIDDHWVNVEICPIEGLNGKVEEAITYIRDVTRQIHAEERLKLVSLQLITNQEDERRRIAQDLHDDIGQSVTALILNLKAIHDQLIPDRDDIGDQIKDTIHVVEDIMRHIRQVLYELRPPRFESASLAETLEDFCSSIALSTDLRIVFSCQDQLPLLSDVQATALYRLLQEGMNNAIKHAKATSVWVNLEYLDGEVSISLEDDGEGFDPEQRSSYGIGLQGLQDRFLALGGIFDVESARGKGTRLYGSLPIVMPSAV